MMLPTRRRCSSMQAIRTSDRPHKEITNEGGTLIIIHDADSSEWHFFECLV